MTKPPSEVTVHGRVTWLYHSSPAFSAGVLTTDDGQPVRFRGKFLVQAGEPIAMTGQMLRHQVYGEQLDARQVHFALAVEPAGLAHYLATSPAFQGIGPAKARRIADAVGGDFDRIIREEPARIREAAGLTEEGLTKLRDAWIARSESNALASWLSAYGLTHAQITRIVERFGDQARVVLLADPYLLCREVTGFGFARTDEVAQKLGTAKTHPGRLRAALRDLVTRESDDGHCWVGRSELLSAAVRVLALDDLDAERQVAEQLAAMIGEGEVIEELRASVSRIALPWLHRAEADLAAWLVAHGRRCPPGAPQAGTVDARLEGCGATLTPRQRDAVVLALRSTIGLVVGAAGTGKSYTVSAVCDVAEDLGLAVALCAPTGKAAKRLEEVTGRRASTLHRLLGYDGRGWAHDAEHPLDADLVLVDECSMVSIDLAWRLFSAIDFTRTRLLLIGDHQQLPPVGAGNLLRDLLHRAYIPVCVLDQVIRQAGTLKENAAAILEGRLAPTAPGSPGVPRPWYVVDSLKAPEAVVDALCLLLREKLPALGFDIVRDVQIITPYRKGPLGAERLNIEVQRVVQQARYGATPPPVREGGRPTLQVGDKVMQTRNNYTLDVMNGAIGRVEAISAVPTEDGSRRVLLIDFDGTHVQVPLGSDLERDLTLAYVTTIHKAQGSEFPCVIAILHRQHGYMLHRNLLYTAVTRARQTAILLGDRTGMGLALSTTTVDDRRTWLSIWGACRKKGGIVHA